MIVAVYWEEEGSEMRTKCVLENSKYPPGLYKSGGDFHSYAGHTAIFHYFQALFGSKIICTGSNDLIQELL